jgi:hypothetical protein
MPSPRSILKLVIVSMLAGIILGAVISEATFYFLQDSTRPPKIIELVIPPGTAAQVARGVQPPTIPDTMIFVAGDTLVVKNEDSVNHELGPMWIPSGTSASLVLGEVENYAYSCSFRPDKYLGLDVREPLTLGTRIEGILFTGLPMGILIALYVIFAMPQKNKVETIVKISS